MNVEQCKLPKRYGDDQFMVHRLVPGDAIERGLIYSLMEASGVFNTRLPAIAYGSNQPHEKVHALVIPYSAPTPEYTHYMQAHDGSSASQEEWYKRERDFYLPFSRTPLYARWDVHGRLECKLILTEGEQSVVADDGGEMQYIGRDLGPIYLSVGTDITYPGDGRSVMTIYWESPLTMWNPPGSDVGMCLHGKTPHVYFKPRDLEAPGYFGPSAPRPGKYEMVAQKLDEIEAEMKSIGFWAETPPPDEEIRYGEAWLQFRTIPRLRKVIEERGQWPEDFNVGSNPYREFEGYGGVDHLCRLMLELDRLVAKRGGEGND